MTLNPMPGEILLRERPAMSEPDLATTMAEIGRRARLAAAALALASAEAKVEALREGARAVRDRVPEILAANARDLAEAEDLSPALRDRLALDPRGIEAIAAGLEAIAELPDPVGRVLAQWTRPNGLAIERVAVPLGVIGIIYESRPNVTADAGGLAFKSGNAAILRGGSESFHSSRALLGALRAGLQSAGLPEDAIQLVPTRDRDAAGRPQGGGGDLAPDPCRSACRRLRIARRPRGPGPRQHGHAGDRAGLADRISRRDPRGPCCRWRRRGD